jgi:hypothetical protein
MQRVAVAAAMRCNVQSVAIDRPRSRRAMLPLSVFNRSASCACVSLAAVRARRIAAATGSLLGACVTAERCRALGRGGGPCDDA